MLTNILSGIQAYATAFQLLSKLKLWRYFAIPIVISLLTASVIVFSAYSLSDIIGAFIAQIWVWNWGKEVVNTIAAFVGIVVVVVIGFILYKHIVLALSAPFMSPVSEKIEIHINGKLADDYKRNTFFQLLLRGVKINLRNLTKELLITIPILFLKLIPGVNIFSTILLFFIQSYYAGFGNIDYTLERHMGYRQSINFVKQHKGIAIGNGIIFILFLFLPVLGIILVLPLSVTAASIKTVKALHHNLELNS